MQKLTLFISVSASLGFQSGVVQKYTFHVTQIQEYKRTQEDLAAIIMYDNGIITKMRA